MRTPVKALSGGEQNRAVLAQLFSQSCNLLVLDEPTNDLDIETLELLEEILLSFEGTVLLVSHDREFMDNVVTSLLVLKGDGVVEEQAGGYSDWEARGGRLEEIATTHRDKAPVAEVVQVPEKPKEQSTPRKRKLSYKDQRELDALPEKIEALETRQAELEEQMGAADFYQQEHTVVQEVLEEVGKIEQELEQALERWTELEG